jgi:ribosomal protein S18 acetylase RimI-like enzyme
MDVEIRDLRRGEIPLVRDLPPREWHLPFDEVLEQHLGRPYFHGLVACRGGRPVGIANGFANGQVGWLGNIVVREAERGQGIGTRLTARIAEALFGGGCQSVLLVATKHGEPIYRKLGFESVSCYAIYRGERIEGGTTNAHVRPLGPADHAAVLAMDSELTGENRAPLLAGFLHRGWIYQRSRAEPILGYYLPTLGAGPIYARNEEAGLSLLGFKHGEVGDLALVPEPNDAARRFLSSHGYLEIDSVPRMQRGAPVAWRPRAIFARGAGYLG